MPNKKINQLSSRTPSLTDLMLVGDPSTGYSYKATLSVVASEIISTLNTTNWDTAYNRSLTSAAVTGTTTKTLTLTKQDGSTLTASWSDLNTDAVTSVFGRTGVVVAANGDYNTDQVTEGTSNLYFTNARSRSSITLTTIGTSGAATYNSTTGELNIPNYAGGGINSINGLTATTQTFATGTSGTDFAIVSSTSTHTFNLPTASATNRGALSSADWSTFNSKQDTITLTTTGSSGSATLVGATLNVPTYTLAGLGGQTQLNGTGFVKISGTTISYDNSTYYLASNPSGYITLASLSASAPLSYSSGVFSISQATTSTDGYLSSTDWNTFNNKQNAITLTTTGNSGAATLVGATLNIPTYTLSGLGGVPTSRTLTINGTAFDLSADRSWTISGGVTGSGTTNYVPKWTSSSALGNSIIFDNGTNVGIGTTSSGSGNKLYVLNGSAGSAALSGNTQQFGILRLSGTGTPVLDFGYVGSSAWMQNYTNSSNLSTFGLIYINAYGGNVAINEDGAGVAPSLGGGLVIGDSRNTQNYSSLGLTKTGVGSFLIAHGNGITYLGTYANQPIRFFTNSADRANLFGNGNFAIGTNTDSGYKLDVYGKVYSRDELSVGTDAIDAVITLRNGGNTSRISNLKGGSIKFEGPSGNVNLIQEGLQFLFRNNAGTTYIWFIGSTQRIGVKNSNPSYDIDITGNLRSTTDAYLATSSGSVGVATTTVGASAIMQIDSTTKGFLPPRMTSTQRGAISSPAVGLVVYQTDGTEGLYENTSTGWRIINSAGGGGGITSMNGLTAATQTFAVGTSGTDFAISSTTSTHTFNLPTASATNRGALIPADWTTFNNKQKAITSGTAAPTGGSDGDIYLQYI